MFTKRELNVLQSALRQYRGIYPNNELVLTNEEIERHKDSLKIADNLASRFEEILQHYFEMENPIMQDESL